MRCYLRYPFCSDCNNVKGMTDMHSNIFLKKILRGSSNFEAAEKSQHELLSTSFLKQRNRSNEVPTDTSDFRSENIKKVVQSERINH